jgi:hypothetical protein
MVLLPGVEWGDDADSEEGDLMFRQRVHIYAKTIDGWNEAIALAEEFNKLCVAKGWTPGTVWMQTVGDGSEIIGEFDFPDLATFQRENEESIHDPEAVALFRKFEAIERERSGYTELLESAITLG